MTYSRRAATRFLASVDADWARLVDEVGPCGLVVHPTRSPYEALVRSVAYQQVHGRAGDAIMGRFMALAGSLEVPAPEQVLALAPEAIRACGFSERKVNTIQGIARGALEGVVPSRRAAARLSNAALIERLVVLRGVGRWTVEMMLMHTLGRGDVWPVDDFGVREGYRILKGWAEQPKPKMLAELGAPLSPYRSAAAWYLWQVPRAWALSPLR